MTIEEETSRSPTKPVWRKILCISRGVDGACGGELKTADG